MIKSELVARLTARYPHLYHRDVERIVTTVLDSISKALADGHRVELRGFGAFSVKVRPSRMGRNPRTGEPVSVGQKRAPFFRTGKELRERLNGGNPAPSSNPVFVAIDTTDLGHARQLASRLYGSVGGLKLGLEFFSAHGPGGVKPFVEMGLPVFLDLKYHDIPNTVAGACRA